MMEEAGVGFASSPNRPTSACIGIEDGIQYHFGIDYMRDVWYESSYKLDVSRAEAFVPETVSRTIRCSPYSTSSTRTLPESFLLTDSQRNAALRNGIKAAVIREKGTQCERETAYALYLAGFDVKDVHMTDLASGRETLEDVNFIVFCGGFSNSDVLGSAKAGPAVSCITRKPRKRSTTITHVKIR